MLYPNALRFVDIREGAVWQFPWLEQEADYQSYHDGNFARMFAETPTAENGLAIVADAQNRLPHMLTTNYFRITADFFVNALFADAPSIVSDAPARQAVIDASQRELMRQMRQAMRWRIIKGYGVLLVDDAGVTAIDASYYFPVVNERRQLEAHLLAYPYRAEPTPYNQYALPDRMLATLFNVNTGAISYELYTFGGDVLGQLLETGSSDARALFVFGDGRSYFTDSVNLVREIAIRRTVVSKILNRHGQPHMQGPANAPDPFILNAKGDFLARDTDGGGYSYLTYDGSLAEQQTQIDALEDALAQLLATPGVVFGTNAGRGESAIARDRLMFAALSRVSAARLEMESFLPALLDAAGAPTGSTEIIWPAHPLMTFTERVDAVLKLFSAGLITDSEARRQIGGIQGNANMESAAPPTTAEIA